MEPRIIEQGEMVIVGMVYYGNPFWDTEASPPENEIGKLWTRFNNYWQSHREEFQHTVDTNVWWELHIDADEYEETKEYFVMVGARVSEIEGLPAPIFAKVLPAGQYAVFTLQGEEMTGNWGDAIYQEWLPSSAYEEAYSCTIERYDEARFEGWGDPDSEVQIWVPVKARQSARRAT
jgi:predicted transcriptional regulator YdeE